jgi:hypothetical protein
MKRLLLIMCCAIAAAVLYVAPVLAHDVDGPNDCQKQGRDFGDAPECIPAYPPPVAGGAFVIGKFPTCTVACPPIGTFDVSCPPISIPPGPTGFVVHVFDVNSYWLGCYPTPIGPEGIDSEVDGKTNTPAVGFSACASIPTDCVEPAFGMTFDQDECYGDGSDAGITAPIVFGVCTPSKFSFNVTNCSQPRQVFLNVCVDWNADGDWNDNFICPGTAGCAYEWAVKNLGIVLSPGCSLLDTPFFLSGPKVGPGWLRISLSDNPAPDDYPWNGTVSIGQFINGETEDYPIQIIDHQTPTRGNSWGRLKINYR